MAEGRVRLLVARHGEAEYETDLWSDDGGSLTALGRRQATELGRSLAGEVSHVWCSPLARAVQTAELVAAEVGCGVTVRQGLREFGVGVHAGLPDHTRPFDPVLDRWVVGELDARVAGAESGREVVDRVVRVIDEAAGATDGVALVVSHGGAICTGVTAAARNLDLAFPMGEGRSLRNCGTVEMVHDGEAWWVTRWQDEALPLTPAPQDGDR